jgi:hypothetical protein
MPFLINVFKDSLQGHRSCNTIKVMKTVSPKMILEARMEGGRKGGRPRKRWLDDAEHDLQQLGVRNWRLKMWDRVEWRTVVREAKVQLGL